ncbi:hypothetical protein J1N35_004731 [Gossypium stocksii]|uniref:Uncharacterized protein n=1 Tax=Gossypium stocksii TaxID=47602 RepID=A0A9D3WCI2_9ROSI|nr:hypothetical protein J1N35_004731 [Gossypium stocksii]
MSLEELICHMKIKEINHFKDKDPIIASELSLKVNLVESSYGPKFNREMFIEFENLAKSEQVYMGSSSSSEVLSK